MSIIDTLNKLTKDFEHCPRAACSAFAVTNEDCPDEVWGVNTHPHPGPCVVEEKHCVSSIHAEASMVARAARLGIALSSATVYSLERPCQRCIILMYEAGISKVYYVNDYHTKAHGDEYVSPEMMEMLQVEKIEDSEVKNK